MATSATAIPTRPLGKTGVNVSCVGLGGHHLGDMPSSAFATDVIHAAIDAGVTYLDNCWEYHNGKSEEWLGNALRTMKHRRDEVFVVTKVCTHGRDGDLAMQMLEQSLRRLGTDHLDLWHIHGVTFDNDPELAYRTGGVIEALTKAKQQGKVRFTGFTGHKDPHLHLRMVQMGFPFDAVQMPLNAFDATFRSFETMVLPELNKRGIAPLGMKALQGTGEAVKKGVASADELLRYAMSLPVATTITGIESRERLDQAVRIASGFTPMSAADMDALRKKCAPTAADGRFEPYKVSLKYDNPEARRAHDFPVDMQQKEIKEEFDPQKL